MSEIFQRLAQPFPPERVSWRVGSTNRRKWEEAKKQGQAIDRKGQPLCYIDARDVMDRLDEVVGHANWQTDHIPMHNGTMCCRIGIRVGEEWIWRTDGAGPTGDIEVPAQREMAQKGGYSDAFKRAAVLFGVGRYLYDVGSPWITLDDYWGIPKDAYANLRALLERNGSPAKSARKARSDGDYERIEKLLRGCKTTKALATLWKNEQAVILHWPDEWRARITDEKDACKERLEGEAVA
jgi:hypothetical protein